MFNRLQKTTIYYVRSRPFFFGERFYVEAKIARPSVSVLTQPSSTVSNVSLGIPTPLIEPVEGAAADTAQ